MKTICATKDLAIQAFAQPFTVHTPAEAVRSFRDEVNRKDGKSAIAQHPDDYELYKIGDYNEENGKITTEAHYPELIVRAKDLINPEN